MNNLKLPLLDFTAEYLEFSGLERTAVIAIQHLLLTTWDLFQSLFNANLDPSNLYLLGKCYSTDFRVIQEFESIGCKVDSGSSFYNSQNAYDDDFDRIVRNFLSQSLEALTGKDIDRVIILDDGGHLIESLFVYLKSLSIPFVAIEQTSSGYNRLCDKELPFPIINLARCRTKLEYEPPLILDSVMRQFNSSIGKQLSSQDKILVLGNGILGSKVISMIPYAENVICFDTNPHKSDVTVEDLPDAIREANYLIGCTGNISIPESLHHYLSSEKTLVSISSSDREFDAVHIRKELPPVLDCHLDISTQRGRLLNGGFPINFKDDRSSADSEEFQFTRSLILVSVFQALNTNPIERGFINLDEDLEQIVADQFLKLQASVRCS